MNIQRPLQTKSAKQYIQAQELQGKKSNKFTERKDEKL